MEFKGLYFKDIALLVAFILVTALSIPVVGWGAQAFAGHTALTLLALPVGLIGVLGLYLRSPRMVWTH
ncbi:MAG TPA: hypothetical protein VHS06_07010 [Chloroflexota bacterium]|nr:hypothetical protein [Chloroflexota bacterium]HEX2987904.1 hypothetical protein [Chloroflexota bacterium]